MRGVCGYVFRHFLIFNGGKHGNEREFGITTTKRHYPDFFTVKTVSTFVKTKVLTEISISTLEIPVSRIVKP